MKFTASDSTAEPIADVAKRSLLPTFLCTKCGWSGREPRPLNGLNGCQRCSYLAHKLEPSVDQVALARAVLAGEEENARLREALGNLPKTADGAPISTLDMRIFYVEDGEAIQAYSFQIGAYDFWDMFNGKTTKWNRMYSTREAALAAGAEEKT